MACRTRTGGLAGRIFLGFVAAFGLCCGGVLKTRVALGNYSEECLAEGCNAEEVNELYASYKEECLGEGCLRPMPSPAVEAEHPDPPRLVMTRHDGPGPVVDLRLTRLALIPRSRRWGRVATRLGAVGSAAGGTDHTSGPAALPDGVATLRVLKEMRDVPDQVSVA